VIEGFRSIPARALCAIASAIACTIACLPAAHAADATPPASPQVEITYATPQAALDALRLKQGVTIREENDWYVVKDPAENAFWSITSPAHPAHPTAVKRTLVQDADGMRLAMRVQCGAAKATCERV